MIPVFVPTAEDIASLGLLILFFGFLLFGAWTMADWVLDMWSENDD